MVLFRSKGLVPTPETVGRALKAAGLPPFFSLPSHSRWDGSGDTRTPGGGPAAAEEGDGEGGDRNPESAISTTGAEAMGSAPGSKEGMKERGIAAAAAMARLRKGNHSKGSHHHPGGGGQGPGSGSRGGGDRVLR